MRYAVAKRRKLSRLPLTDQLSVMSLSQTHGRGGEVGRGLGVGIGLGAIGGSTQYLPPLFKALIPSGVPPHTIISLPVQTAA